MGDSAGRQRVAATYSPPLIPVDASTPSSNQGEVENQNDNYRGYFFEMNPWGPFPK
jgi:hypothetical protein